MIKFILFFLFLTSNAFAQNIAVVIVDMQYGFYTRGRALQTNGLIQLVQKQKELLTWVKNKKLPVIFFEYDGYQETDSALTNTLWGYKFKTITKYDDNGFSGQSGYEANEYLQSKEIDTLIVAGINASGCVKRTVVGALNDGYKIISSSDIVADLYQNPPTYPQSDWFIPDSNFKGYESLEAMLDDLEVSD
jgi:nicotinamidase-related amidase